MWTKRSKLCFLLSFGIAGIVLLEMVTYALHVLFGWHFKFNLLEICNSWMTSKGIFSVVYGLDALVLYTFGVALRVFGRQLWLTRGTYQRLRLYHKSGVSLPAPNAADCTVVDCSRPFAFTMGLWKPQIYLSTGLLLMLEPGEAEAVVQHERFHQLHADPLKTFILALSASMFRYIPLLRWLFRQYKIAREVLADRYAIDRLGSSAELGSALLKLLKEGQTVKFPFAYASFTDISVNDRIRQLLDPQAQASWIPPLISTIISVAILVGLSVLLLWASF